MPKYINLKPEEREAVGVDKILNFMQGKGIPINPDSFKVFYDALSKL